MGLFNKIMDKVSSEDYKKMLNRGKAKNKVVVLCYECVSKSITYGILNTKKDENIQEEFKDWNGDAIPFIYKEVSYKMLRSNNNRNFILTRFDDSKGCYQNVLEEDVSTIKRLVIMRREDV